MKLAKNRLLLEFFILFILFPPLLALMKPHTWMYSVLWVVTLLAGRWLSNHSYNLKQDWNVKAFNKKLLKKIFMRFAPLSVFLTFFTLVMIPEQLFNLPRQKPEIWVMVMIFYPFLSVAPQEFVFRSFFFKRYATLFLTPTSMITASAVAFGWMHILLLNWVAVVFSFVGGLIFASSYRKTRSLAVVCFEHAIYGCMVFTLGLGYYFYHGNAAH